MFYFFLGALVLFFAFIPKTDYYRPKWLLLIFSTIIYVCFQIYKLSPFAALFAFYCWANAFYCGNIKHVTHGRSFNFQSAYESNLAIAFGLSVVSMALWLPREFLFDLAQYMPGFITLSALCCLILPKVQLKNKAYPIPIYGFGANPSVDSTFMSLMCGYMLINPPPYYQAYLLMGLGVLIRNKAATGFGSFIAMLIVYYLPQSLWAIPFLLLATFIAYKKNPKFFALNGRKEIYAFAYEALRPYWKPLVGIGIGMTGYIYPVAQIQMKRTLVTKGVYFIWLHNDYLTLLLEGGIIAVVLALFFFGHLGFASWESRGLLAFFVCYLANCGANFPSHLAPDSLLFAFASRLAFDVR